MSITKNYHFVGALFVFIILSYFSLFHQLGKQPMHLWDESSYALNAQEMIEKGNPIEIFLLDEPDLFNSKPPFAIWCSAICIKIFGFNELGVRMSSAFFAFLSALLLWLIGIKTFKNYWMALSIPMVLLSSYGFVGWHTARTGDTDSVLAFWILLQSIFLYEYTTSDSKKKATTYLILFGFAFSFGCLTKGIAGLTAVPGLFAWIVYNRQLKETLLNKGFYIAIVSFLILVIGYYALRSYLTEGYFNAVMENEIGGRLERQDFLNQKTLPFYFYFELMFTQNRFFGWVFVLPVCLIYILRRTNNNTKNLGVFFIFIFTSIALLLALSKTKLEWYDAPLYSIMAIIIGTSFYLISETHQIKIWLLFICLFSLPFYNVISNNCAVANGSSLGNFMKQIRAKGHKKDSVYMINSGPNFVMHFYAKKDCLRGNNCKVVSQNDPELHAGSFILTQQYERDVDVNNLFILEPILRFKECSYYRIINKK
jgi:4-amino-4-deoxy-L-arabinose transferase-like glycosyltransferase